MLFARIRIAVFAGLAVAMLLSGAARAAAQPNVAPQGAPPPSPGSQQPPAPPQVVSVKDGRLTVNVRNQSLHQVLDRISRQAQIPIIEGDDFSSQRMTVAFENLPLEDGLRLILQQHDAFFFVGVGKTPPATVQVVWVYDRGKGRGIAPVPPEMWASSKEIEERLASPNPDDRGDAIEALVKRKGEQARELVLQALADPDDHVRARALNAATNEMDVPSELLMQAMSDRSGDVRFLALRALTDRPEAQAAAEHARYDPNPVVRQEADEILKRLAKKGAKR